MIRYFCQTLYLAVLCATLSAGCVALASGPDPGVSDFPGDGALRAEVWGLAGWLGPAQARSAGDQPSGDLYWREAFVPAGEGAPPLRVAMGFSDGLSAWPMALEVECQGEGPDGAPAVFTVRDARPFGRDNQTLKNPVGGPGDPGEGQRVLENCLAQARAGLSAGPYFEPFEWEELEPGLWRARTAARYGPRLGPKEIMLVRASPDRFRLAPYHESERDDWKDAPGTIRAWAKRLPDSPFLINGGQYYPNRGYMGTLRRQGKDIGGPAHKTFKGFWVQDPLPGGPGLPPATLVDRELEGGGDLGPDGYGTVIQSYMVLDGLGRVRVKTSERLASRAVLGFDREGRVVCVAALGAITMSDLALLTSKLGLVSALGLDGGLETQLAFNGKNGIEVRLGKYANNFLGNFLVDDLNPSLPSVIAFERLPGPAGAPVAGP
ncbi:MAG: phosphodiester glycosidase family protein [Deltaproteobacteria bacterium]|jgi:hypothetical protein|nr:phosphodiester glycosidase family protein [Deltaproteobacteria bacterium]